MDKNFFKNMNPIMITAYSTHLKKDWILESSPYPNRIVESFELDFVIEGTGYINTDGLNIKTKKGRLFIRYPNMKVQGVPPYQSIFFTINLFSKSDSSLYDELKKLPLFIDTYSFDKYLGDFLTLYRMHQNKDSSELEKKIFLLELIKNIFDEIKILKIKKSQVKNYRKVQKIKNYINSNPTLNFDLNSLADKVNLSPNFLCKKFKEYQKDSLFQYINKVKIEQAKAILATTQTPISKIASNLSFNSDTYFYTLFKKLTRDTPNSYRNKNWNEKI